MTYRLKRKSEYTARGTLKFPSPFDKLFATNL